MSVSDRAIATANRKRHQDLCREVVKDLSAIRSVGAKLIELHELGVFKETHKTFELFVRDLFNLERQQAYRLMDAARVSNNLSPIGDKVEVPKLESQLREVAKAPAEKQAEVVKKAAEIAEAEGRKPTAKDYKKVVGELVPDGEPEKPKPSKPQPKPLSKEEQVQANRKLAREYIAKAVNAIDAYHAVKPNQRRRLDVIKLLQQAGANLW